MAATGSEYKKNAIAGITTFDVSPAPAPKSLVFLAIGGVLVLGSLLVGAEFLALGVLLAIPAIWAGLRYDPRPKNRRRPTQFQVTADGIESGGQSIAAGDINRFTIRNSITDSEVGIDTGRSLSSYSNILDDKPTLGYAIGRSVMEGRTGSANSLYVEAGGKAIHLAGGMDSITAFGLRSDVERILGRASSA